MQNLQNCIIQMPAVEGRFGSTTTTPTDRPTDRLPTKRLGPWSVGPWSDRDPDHSTDHGLDRDILLLGRSVSKTQPHWPLAVRAGVLGPGNEGVQSQEEWEQ